MSLPKSIFTSDISEKQTLSVLQDHFIGVPNNIKDVIPGHVFTAKDLSGKFPGHFKVIEKANPGAIYDGITKLMYVKQSFDPEFKYSLEAKGHWIQVLKNFLVAKKIDFLAEVDKKLNSKTDIDTNQDVVQRKLRLEREVSADFEIVENRQPSKKELSPEREKKIVEVHSDGGNCKPSVFASSGLVSLVAQEILPPEVYIEDFYEKEGGDGLSWEDKSILMGHICCEVERRFGFVNPVISILSKHYKSLKIKRNFPQVFPDGYFYGKSALRAKIVSRIVFCLDLAVNPIDNTGLHQDFIFVDESLSSDDILVITLYEILNYASELVELDFESWRDKFLKIDVTQKGIHGVFNALRESLPELEFMIKRVYSYAFKQDRGSFEFLDHGMRLINFNESDCAMVLEAKLRRLKYSKSVNLLSKITRPKERYEY